MKGVNELLRTEEVVWIGLIKKSKKMQEKCEVHVPRFRANESHLLHRATRLSSHMITHQDPKELGRFKAAGVIREKVRVRLVCPRSTHERLSF